MLTDIVVFDQRWIPEHRTDNRAQRLRELAVRAQFLAGWAHALMHRNVPPPAPLTADSPAAGPAAPAGVRLLPACGAFIVVAGRIAPVAVDGVRVFRSQVDPRAFPHASPAVKSDPYWHLKKIGASQKTLAQPYLVGFLDSGIDPTHEDFRGLDIHYGEFDALYALKPGAPAHDPDGHGTHVAGLVAGWTYGVAPGTHIAMAAVLPDAVFDSARILAGIEWLLATEFRPGIFGVDLINASMGGTGYDEVFRTPLQRALVQGTLTIAAVGNNGTAVGLLEYPANYEEVLAVGATREDDRVWLLSAWGVSPTAGAALPVPQLSAPGEGITSTATGGTARHVMREGTSMAAAIVTGVAVLRMSRDPSLWRAPTALRESLMLDLAPLVVLLNEGGWGRINANPAAPVDAASGAAAPCPD